MPGAMLGAGKTEVGDQGWVPAPEELLVSLGHGHKNNAERWDKSHNKVLYKGQ